MCGASKVKTNTRVVYITGIDGSGKTTATEIIKEEYEKMGYAVDVMWLRYNNLLSKPLLAFCRLIGLTKYETVNGIKVGYHHFYKSKIISWLFIFFQYLDAARVKYFKIRPALRSEKKILILDRYVYDILIDICVDTKMDLMNSRAARLFKRLLPENNNKILISRDYDSVLGARPEAGIDHFFESRYNLFRKLENDNAFVVVKNDSTLYAFKQSIIESMRNDEK